MKKNLFDLSGKVALITGGNGGIGLGFAQALAQAGADIAIWGRNEEKNHRALEILSQFDTKVKSYTVDVSSKDTVSNAVSTVLKDFGRIDSCFANAGIGPKGGRFENIDEEEWDLVNTINVKGVVFTFQAVAKHMMERIKGGDGSGRLVVTSSTAAISGAPRSEHYAASKGALSSLAKGLAVEYAQYGITCNAIVPGWIETEMTEKKINNRRFAGAVLPRIPVGRWGAKEDFGGIAVYLASDASSFHTGDDIRIDGGYYIF